MLVKTIINDKYLKEFSPIPLNFDTKEIQNYIKLSEVQWILPVIGQAWYDELIDQVQENDLTEENSTALVEAIWPYLGYAVALESVPFLWANISQVGITLGKSDNSDSINLKDLTLIQQHLRTQTEARKDYCIKWLDQHAGSFPLYHPTDCCCDICQSNKGKLHKPNPLLDVYTPPRRWTKII